LYLAEVGVEAQGVGQVNLDDENVLAMKEEKRERKFFYAFLLRCFPSDNILYYVDD